MTDEILNTRCPLFRWQDCGDIISIEHLEAINQICLNTPTVKHWLPTMENHIVRHFILKHQKFASNLTVRISSKLIDQIPNYDWKYSSMVSRDVKQIFNDKAKFNGENFLICNAHKWSNRCWVCSGCWTFKGIIIYPLH